MSTGWWERPRGPAADPVRLLVADVDPQHRTSLVLALAVERDLELLSPVPSPEGLELAAPFADVVLLVGDLGTGRGEAALVAEAGLPGGPPWVVLTRSEEGERDDVDEVLTAGAHGALVLTSTPLQIVAAVRAAARGELAHPTDPVTGPLVQRRAQESALTEREVEVLRLVGLGLGNQSIADRLYLSVSSVKSHLSHTYGRLGVHHREAAVAEARRRGLL